MDQADQKILKELNQSIPHERKCLVCNKNWKIEPDDLKLFKMLIVPIPQTCPDCSIQIKTAFRNERSLYKRKCDATGKDIISIISPDKKYTVYDKDYWFSDNWNPLDYGRNYDFSRSFFEQINELIHTVPYISLLNINADNSDYLNHAKDNKDCYLLSQAVGNLNCLYGKFHLNNQDCVDNLNIIHCQNCYQNIEGINNTNCHYLHNSEGCFNCHFSAYLTNCQDCFLCVNLRNKQYHFKNKQYPKEQYEKLVNEINWEKTLKKFIQLRHGMIVKYTRINNSQNCSGDLITNSKDCHICFAIDKAQNCKYIYDSPEQQDSYDCFSAGLDSQLEYNCCTSGQGNKKISSFGCVGSSETHHSFICFDCTDVFGCVGLRKKQYCLFNKQYSEEKYRKLVEKIKLAMLAQNEYGEFFPPQLSPFGYNETIAPDYFPLTKEEAIKLSFNWSDYKAEGKYDGPWYTPMDIKEYYDENKAKELLAGVLKCEVTGKPFKIMGPELAFYLKHNIPIPNRSPNQRHKDRMALKNPYKLWHRQCLCEEKNHEHPGRCPNEFETTYAPERTEKVYCESCYQKSVI